MYARGLSYEGVLGYTVSVTLFSLNESFNESS